MRTVTNSIRSRKSGQVKPPGQDRRSHRRYPISVELKYSAGVQAGHGRTINLSSGGVLFEADVALSINLRLEVYVPGKTVRVEGTKVAVKFDRAVFRTAKHDGGNDGRKRD